MSQTLSDLKIDAATLDRWLVDPVFREKLTRVMRLARKTRELQLGLSARHAADVLHEMAQGKKPAAKATQRQACVDLIQLARRKPAVRGKSPGHAEPQPPTGQPHPEVDPNLFDELAEAIGD